MTKHLGNMLEPIAADGRSTAPTRCAGSWPPSGSPWQARRVGHAAHPGDRAQGAADLLEHRLVPVALRPHRRAGRPASPAPRRRRPSGARPVGAVARPTGWRARSTAALEAFDTQRAGRAARRLRRRPVQLVRPPVAAPVLGRRPRGAGDAARVPGRRDPADGAAHAVHHRAGLAGPRSPSTSDELPGLGAPRRLADASTARWSTTSSPTQMALVRRLVELGRAARAEAKVRTRQPLGRALVGGVGWPTLPDELRAEVADELNVGAPRAAGVGRRRPRRHLGQGQLPGARQAVRPSRRRWSRPRSPPPTPPRSPPRWPATGGATVDVDGEAVEVIARRGDRHRDAPREGWRWSTSGRDRRPRPRAHPGAASGRAGPRGRTPGPGGAQDQRLRRVRPDPAALGGRRRDGRGAARARRRWWPTRCSPPRSCRSRPRRSAPAPSPTAELGLQIALERV